MLIYLCYASQVLQEHYGAEGIAENGLEVFVTSVSKIFDSLQAAYKGLMVSSDHNYITIFSCFNCTFSTLIFHFSFLSLSQRLYCIFVAFSCFLYVENVDGLPSDNY